ncbi:MAG TPA: helix-turn-helix domain-containing protein [Micromonosporaceae bacterium]|nr:helix-turn-helix domain-containing protein [Micromonosporaceae bacterium]
MVFSGDDIARVRLAPAADPIWELILSLHLLQQEDRSIAGWRSATAGRLRRAASGNRLRLLLALNPPRGYFPDFLTPYASLSGFSSGINAIRSTPAALLQRDLTLLAEDHVLPSSAAALARGDAAAVRHLTDSMELYQRLAITPYWTRIQAAVEADRAQRARALLDGGVDALLSSLRPAVKWDGGRLEVPEYPADREVDLAGRGLVLVPSFFCCRVPVALADPALPQVLVYPVDRLGGLASGPALSPAWSAETREAGREALAALLGRTRAAVLEAIDDGCSTGEVARRLMISAAAASQHATVLRNAGLLVSRRDRNTVVHTLTPLGRALLNG